MLVCHDCFLLQLFFFLQHSLANGQPLQWVSLCFLLLRLMKAVARCAAAKAMMMKTMMCCMGGYVWLLVRARSQIVLCAVWLRAVRWCVLR